MDKLVRCRLKDSLKRDAKSVCGGLYSMNARNAIGYLFNPTVDGKKVATGMFCDRLSEIEAASWTYYLDFKTHAFKEIKPTL